MKHIPNVIGGLLGLAFIAFGSMVLFNLIPPQPLPPEGTPAFHMMSAFGPTGYMKFIKFFEVLGGVLVAIPKTRNLGLLVLGPIIVNILAFHLFIAKGEGLFSPVLVVIVVFALYLLWAGRKNFAALLDTQPRREP